MVDQSSQLKEFYRAYRDWSVDPETNPYGFSKHTGLCTSLGYFCEQNGYDIYKLDDEMLAQFVDAGLNKNYPFTTESRYEDETADGLILNNMKRLLWVNEHCR